MSQLIHDVKRALRVRQVANILGIGVSSVWRLAKTEPDFPKPFSLSPRVTVWALEEVVGYIEIKRTQRDEKQVVA